MEKKNQTILEWYRENQNYIDAPCGGNGVCGKCKVRFKTEAPIPTPKEKELLSSMELKENVRLACVCSMPESEEMIFEPVGDFWRKIDRDIEHTKILRQESLYGIAIDIGTTTLVMSLIEVQKGETLKSITQLNPQRMYGADVLTRIRTANEGNLKKLQHLLKEALEDMFKRLLRETGVSALKIEKVAIVGNTTMLHLLLGYSCEGLGKAPFTPVTLKMHKLNEKDCDIKIAPQAVIYVLPGISTFIGADIVAGIYACDMDLKEEVGMLVDIGTNGEMVIGSRQGFWVASTAAGPVFEGGGVSYGMPAIEGAITHLTYEDNKWKYECLGNNLPVGICGSGLIDLLAGLYGNNFIDENGTLEECYFENGYVITKEPFIAISQADIRELQMGKAAIRAGVEILKEKNTPRYVYVAGAFGSGLCLESAAKIGLFGAEDIERVTVIGNTALEGAKKFLMDPNGEERLLRIVAVAKEIVLANDAGFEERYIENMQFTE